MGASTSHWTIRPTSAWSCSRTPNRPCKRNFPQVFVSTADLYVYFYARTYQLLRPGGQFALISSNSFMRAAYAEPLRQLLLGAAWLQQVIDLGDTQVFAGAKDLYPAIVIATKAAPRPNATVRSLRLRREDRADELNELVKRSSINVSLSDLDPAGWRFDEPTVAALRKKMALNSTSLGELLKGKIYRGLITGLNEAFVVDSIVKSRLVTDGRSGEILKPFIGGQHLRCWYAEDSGNWLIMIPNGATAAALPQI